MPFLKDSPLVSRVVPTASSEQGLRAGGASDIKAITIHMAEGGGTVAWLARPDGNSSHYVVEYSGAIVQMVPERNWAGSINPKLVRRDNDPAYTFMDESIAYGRAAQLAAVGPTAAADPNRHVIAFEVEGFAVTGPNAAQRGSLRALVADIRRRRGSLPCLGHRDWQNYKACPGHRIPWADYGGHARKVGYKPPVPEVDVDSFVVPEKPTLAKVIAGAWLYDNGALKPSPGNVKIDPAREFDFIGWHPTNDTARIIRYEPQGDDPNVTSRAMFVVVGDIITRLKPTDCAAEIAAAISADRAKAHIVY